MLIAAWTNIDGIKDETLAVVGLGDTRFELIGRAATLGEAKQIAAEACMDFYHTSIVWPGSSAVWTERMEIEADDAADDAAADYWVQCAKDAGAKMQRDMTEANATMARIQAEIEEAA
jgi:hypothetical protein